MLQTSAPGSRGEEGGLEVEERRGVVSFVLFDRSGRVGF